MTLTQLEYVVAVDSYRHFALAAEHCYITQPTLSMQIQKLELELGIKIFDRSKQPVVATDIGEEIIIQARRILHESALLQQIVNNSKGLLQGDLKLGIIPTLAPYLLPLFIPQFTKKYPSVKLKVTDLTTQEIVEQLRNGRLDAGLLVTPLQDATIREYPLFYEEMVGYVSKSSAAYDKTYLEPGDLIGPKLWLLEEGHCFRGQILNLCDLKRASTPTPNFEYEAGSIETLRKMVETNSGVTVLPELATLDISAEQFQLIRHFKSPAPVREISLVIHRDFVKRKLIEVLREEIVAVIPDKIKKNKPANVVKL